jgi:hypothetical protein
LEKEIGTVFDYQDNEDGRFGFIEGANRKIYYASARNIYPDEQASIFLIPGESVSFVPAEAEPHEGHAPALEIEAFERIDINNADPTPQLFVVVKFNPESHSGFARRAAEPPPSPWHYFNEKAFLEPGEIGEGDFIRAGLERNKRNLFQFRLINIEFVSEAEIMKEITK